MMLSPSFKLYSFPVPGWRRRPMPFPKVSNLVISSICVESSLVEGGGINLYSVNLDVFLQVGQGIVLVSMFGMFLTIRMQLQFGHFIFSVSGTIVFVFLVVYYHLITGIESLNLPHITGCCSSFVTSFTLVLT